MRIGPPKSLNLFTSVRPPFRPLGRPLGAIAEDLKHLGALAEDPCVVGRPKKIGRKIGFLWCFPLSLKSQMTTKSI